MELRFPAISTHSSPRQVALLARVKSVLLHPITYHKAVQFLCSQEHKCATAGIRFRLSYHAVIA